MVIFNKEEQKKAHKGLHKEIYDCSCKPYLSPWEYCEKCKNAVLEFMQKYGAGVLTRDEEVEDLQKAFNTAMIKVGSLKQKLEEKIQRVEKLKDKLETATQSIK